LQFDSAVVPPGASYSVTISGSGLTADTFFDVRFTSPGSSLSSVVLNWQRGTVESHDVPAGLAAGTWTINGVRAHAIETDHTGNFVPVSATITVGPLSPQTLVESVLRQDEELELTPDKSVCRTSDLGELL
jgi:hypothetical protein